MIRAISVAAALALAGCEGEALERKATENRDFQVETLFHIDGCQVYRFYDGRRVHFVRCGAHTRTEWRESCGKNCSRLVAVETDSN